jgi:hypothetical protein
VSGTAGGVIEAENIDFGPDASGVYVAPEAVAPSGNSGTAQVETLEDLTIVPLPAFVDVKGEGASALLGTPDAALIPEGGAVMFQQCFQFKSAPKSKPFRVHRTPSESGRGRGELRSSERS